MPSQHRTQPAICQWKQCELPFPARVVDIDRKRGRYCSPSCAGKASAQKRGVSPTAHPEDSAAHLLKSNQPTQKEVVLSLLKRHGKVTMSQFFQNGVGYTFRNRVSELRHDGYRIDCQLGKRPSENIYVLLATPESQPIQASAGGR